MTCAASSRKHNEFYPITNFLMHYLTYVFIPKKTDIEIAVGEAMEPFSEHLQVKPWKKHLDDEEIAKMAKYYRMRRTSARSLAACVEDWSGDKGGVDEKGLFALHTYNPDGKWDWYEVGGRWKGFLRGDVRSAASLLNSPKLAKLLPHDFLTPDGTWHEVETFVRAGWIGGHFERRSDNQWLEEFQQALRQFREYRVACVDRHS